MNTFSDLTTAIAKQILIPPLMDWLATKGVDATEEEIIEVLSMPGGGDAATQHTAQPTIQYGIIPPPAVTRAFGGGAARKPAAARKPPAPLPPGAGCTHKFTKKTKNAQAGDLCGKPKAAGSDMCTMHSKRKAASVPDANVPETSLPEIAAPEEESY